MGSHRRTVPKKTRTPEATSVVITPPTIAVLPFADMSPNHDQEYFADGLSEELANRLSVLPGLRVIGRTSAFSFKGRNENLRTIGQALGVEHLLEGSVRKEGDQLRITAQLVDSNGRASGPTSMTRNSATSSPFRTRLQAPWPGPSP